LLQRFCAQPFTRDGLQFSRCWCFIDHPRLLLKSAMPKNPPNLIYAVDDNPPLGATLLLGLQHIFTLTMSFVLI
jgi:hypothetical protein